MTFSNAVAMINTTGNNATKIPSWHGYVYKNVDGMTEQDVAAGKFELRFVKSDGKQYVFTWDGVGDYVYTGYIVDNSGSLGTGDPSTATKLEMDPDLLEALSVDTWETGTQSYFETQRTGEGPWD